MKKRTFYKQPPKNCDLYHTNCFFCILDYYANVGKISLAHTSKENKIKINNLKKLSYLFFCKFRYITNRKHSYNDNNGCF